MISGTQEHIGLHYIDKDQPFMWSASTHKSCKATVEHKNHVYRGTCTQMTPEVEAFLQANGESVSVPDLVATIRRTYRVSLDYSRVRYYLLKKGLSTNAVGDGASGDGVSGNSMATIKYLLKTKNNSVCLLLVHCASGLWCTGSAELLPNGSVNITASPYSDHEESWRPQPIANVDPDRVVIGTKSQELYYCHTLAWNYHDDARVFEAYPFTVAMDVQANVTKGSDGSTLSVPMVTTTTSW